MALFPKKFTQDELNKILKEQKTVQRLDIIETKIDTLATGQAVIAQRVEDANHWKSDVMDHLSDQDATQERVVNMLAEMQVTTMTPEELAAVGSRAKRDVFFQDIDAQKRQSIQEKSNTASRYMPIITVISLVVSVAVTISLALGWLH